MNLYLLSLPYMILSFATPQIIIIFTLFPFLFGAASHRYSMKLLGWTNYLSTNFSASWNNIALFTEDISSYTGWLTYAFDKIETIGKEKFFFISITPILSHLYNIVCQNSNNIIHKKIRKLHHPNLSAFTFPPPYSTVIIPC